MKTPEHILYPFVFEIENNGACIAEVEGRAEIDIDLRDLSWEVGTITVDAKKDGDFVDVVPPFYLHAQIRIWLYTEQHEAIRLEVVEAVGVAA